MSPECEFQSVSLWLESPVRIVVKGYIRPPRRAQVVFQSMDVQRPEGTKREKERCGIGSQRCTVVGASAQHNVCWGAMVAGAQNAGVGVKGEGSSSRCKGSRRGRTSRQEATMSAPARCQQKCALGIHVPAPHQLGTGGRGLAGRPHRRVRRALPGQQTEGSVGQALAPWRHGPWPFSGA